VISLYNPWQTSMGTGQPVIALESTATSQWQWIVM